MVVQEEIVVSVSIDTYVNNRFVKRKEYNNNPVQYWLVKSFLSYARLSRQTHQQFHVTPTINLASS